MKNKFMTRVIAIILLFCIIPSIFSAKSLATGPSPSSNTLKSWADGMVSRSSNMFIDATFKSDDYPEFKDCFLKLSSPGNGYSFVRTGGTDNKPKFSIKNDSTGEVINLSVKIKDQWGARNVGSVIRKIGSQYYVDLSCSTNTGALDFMGTEIFIKLSDGTESIIRKLPDNEKNFMKLCDSQIYDETTPFFEQLAGAILDPLGAVKNILERLLTLLLLALGDGIVYGISLAIGEQVTLDRVIFNQVEKTSINFFGGGRATDLDDSKTSNSIIPVINDIVLIWYDVFRGITLVVYLVILIYVCIRVMLVSTSREKEKYKMMFNNWVMGIVILFFFPFVMKYTIEINNKLVSQVGRSSGIKITQGVDPDEVRALGDSAIGNENFVKLDNSQPGAPNIMMYIRNLAARQGRLTLVFVYYIMIWQLIVIIILYYKRVFMLAFLITIFPLVVMTYSIDKMRR